MARASRGRGQLAWLCWLSWLLCVLGAPGRASALTLLGPHDEGLTIEAARVVVAAHGERSTVWVQWLGRAVGSRVIALIPLAGGSRLDPGDPDWFAAVEAATAPRILPPAQEELPECAEAHAIHDTTSVAAAEVAHPSGVTWLDDAASLTAFAQDAGFELDQVPAFADDGSTDAFVAVEYSVLEGVPFLVGLRLDEPTAIGAWLERFAALGSSESVPTTLTVIAASPVVFSGRKVVYPEALSPVWHPASGDSNYVEARAAFLDAEPDAWVTEGVGQTPLFTSYFPDALAEVPPVVNAFRERLEARGHDCPDWSAWLDDARADDARAPMSCGLGTLGSSGAVPCGAAEAPSAPLACGEIDDLALALSGARLSRVVVTRHVGLLPARVSLATADAGVTREHTVKVYASRIANCDGEVPIETTDGTGGATGSTSTMGTGGDGSAGSGGTGRSPSYPSTTSGGWEGSGSTGTDGSEWYGPVERGEGDDPEPVVVVEVQTGACSCSDTSSSSEDSCSGSSSSGNDDAACSGDSSSDHESGDDTCSGDSSSDSSGDTCSGSSSGEADGETCSGGSESGDATCSGNSGGDGCAVGQFGLPRPRLSVLTLLLGAGLLPLRRRRRRPR